jgi:hypothetical protein
MKSAQNTSCSEVGLYSETAAEGESPAGHRIRRALDGYATAMVRFIGESYGKESVQYAWREFTIGGEAPFLSPARLPECLLPAFLRRKEKYGIP